jgi:ribosomal-protein-alanine N-acetyltransferase
VSVHLRALRWWDVESVLPLERELFGGDPPWTAEQFWSELAHVPDTRWYVAAEDGGDLVGYAGLRASGPGDPADVQTIAVAPGHQRRGVGTMLMAALIDEAGRRATGDLLLEVRADNAAALEFYARHGFEQIAVRRRYYRDGADGLVLRRGGSTPRARR